MAEIVAFDVDSDNKFNVENRLADPADVLDLCSSLVISVETDSDGDDEVHFDPVSDDDLEDDKVHTISATSTSRATGIVKLAHYSVKEYLVSDRIRTGSAASFSIDEEASNSRIGATCLSCLLLYDKVLFPSSTEFCIEFPLARYSATFWYKHLSAISGTAHLIPLSLATELVFSEDKLRNWIALWDLDWDLDSDDYLSEIFDSYFNIERQSRLRSRGSPLYYAVLSSFKSLVEALIEYEDVYAVDRFDKGSLHYRKVNPRLAAMLDEALLVKQLRRDLSLLEVGNG